MAEDDRPFEHPDAPWAHVTEPAEPEAAAEPVDEAADPEPVDAPVDAPDAEQFGFVVFPYHQLVELLQRGLKIGDSMVDVLLRATSMANVIYSRDAHQTCENSKLLERIAAADERIAAAAERIAVSFETALEIATSE